MWACDRPFILETSNVPLSVNSDYVDYSFGILLIYIIIYLI